MALVVALPLVVPPALSLFVEAVEGISLVVLWLGGWTGGPWASLAHSLVRPRVGREGRTGHCLTDLFDEPLETLYTHDH